MQVNPHPVSYEELIAYAAMEHAARQRTAIAEHVSACLDCTATVIRYQAVRAVLSADDRLVPPATAVARALAILPSPAKPTAAIPSRLWTWPALGRILGSYYR